MFIIKVVSKTHNKSELARGDYYIIETLLPVKTVKNSPAPSKVQMFLICYTHNNLLVPLSFSSLKKYLILQDEMRVRTFVHRQNGFLTICIILQT